MGKRLVYDDGLGRTAEDRARWLYTAITRAERGLVILVDDIPGRFGIGRPDWVAILGAGVSPRS